MEEVKQHFINVHSAKDHLEELVEMCTEAEEKREKEGWSIDQILEELGDRRETTKSDSSSSKVAGLRQGRSITTATKQGF